MKGFVGAETMRYPRFLGADGARNDELVRDPFALKGQLELAGSGEGPWSYGIRGYLREDLHNDDRDDARFDEAWVQYAADNWDVRVGNQLITWGSVESVSSLDIINPRDYEEDIVEPAKVGTPATRLRWRFSSSDLSLYWLPYYQPSLFAGPHSYYSISGGLPQDYPDNHWEQDQWAARYFYSGGGFDFGVSYFSGLERNAAFRLDSERGVLEGETFRARRLGVETTRVVGDWLLKGELVYRSTRRPGNRDALLYSLGVEYTFSSVWEHSDLAVYVEYLAASRNVARYELMQNDLFAALRWTANDAWQQRVLAGTFIDLDHPRGHVYRLEYVMSPVANFDIGARYTDTRNYYPGPTHVEKNDGAVSLFTRFNF